MSKCPPLPIEFSSLFFWKCGKRKWVSIHYCTLYSCNFTLGQKWCCNKNRCYYHSVRAPGTLYRWGYQLFFSNIIMRQFFLQRCVINTLWHQILNKFSKHIVHSTGNIFLSFGLSFVYDHVTLILLWYDFWPFYHLSAISTWRSIVQRARLFDWANRCILFRELVCLTGLTVIFLLD